MDVLFAKVLEMSLSAGWIVLAVLAARLVLRKAPRGLVCCLWALVALRLVCPFSLESDLSLVPNLEIPQESYLQTEESNVSRPARGEILSSDGEVLVSREPQSTEAAWGEILSSDGEVLVRKELKTSVEPPQKANFLPVIWLVGIAAMGLYAAFSYLRIRRKVDVSIHLGNGVYLCDYIDTPFLLGVGKPRIYLPSAIDPRDAAHVLAHERAHLQRRDHWWKPLGFVLLSIHWFNPLLWLAYVLLCRDIELACDERVVRDMDIPEKKAYSDALLKCSVPRHMIAACPLAFGEVGVKHRIRSVLNYRKPGFWVILLGIAVTVIVAVCFLTDPKTPTLADLAKFSQEEITSISVWGRKGYVSFQEEGKIRQFLEFLDTIEYDPEPAAEAPIEEDADENQWSYAFVNIQTKDGVHRILMNYDRTLVWTKDYESIPSLPYRLTGREKLLEFMDQELTPVINRYVDADPFAAGENASLWLKEIGTDALGEAKLFVCRADGTMTGPYLPKGDLEKLLQILNTITETDLGPMQEDVSFNYERLRYPPLGKPDAEPHISVVLTDGANELTGIVRLYGDVLELVLVEGTGIYEQTWEQRSWFARSWTLESDALRQYLLELQQNPPGLSVFAGARYDFQEVQAVISNGDVTIRAYVENNWDYEFIQPDDGEDFFGFRVRPKQETEGWLCFGWWDDKFVPAEQEETVFSNIYGAHYTSTVGKLERDGMLMDYQRYHCFHGDFVFLKEGCGWFEDYGDTFVFYEMMVSLDCTIHTQLTEIPEDAAEALVDTLYYDWDSIAREIGVESMTLFDPQRYHDHLFVGCKHEKGYHIACFEDREDGSYEFVRLYEPEGQFVNQDGIQSIPVVKCSDGDYQYQLYILDDPAVTGLHLGGGYLGYIPLAKYPSLVMLDCTGWADDSVPFTLGNEELSQMVMSISTHNGTRYLQFEGPGYSNSVYLYGSNVQFYDGVHRPGQYSLTQKEIKELINILIDIPPANITHKFMPEHEDLTVNLTLYADNGERLDWEKTVLDFFYNDGHVLLYMDPAFSDEIYYFKIESAALNEFLLDKIDNSRREGDYPAYSQEPVTYSHGDVSMELQRHMEFEWEIVEYTNDETPFGIRMRPIGKDGWLFFSYWPQGFEEDSELYTGDWTLLFQKDGVNQNMTCQFAGKPGSDAQYGWEYVFFPDKEGFAIINEGAEDWLEEYHFSPERVGKQFLLGIGES